MITTPPTSSVAGMARRFLTTRRVLTSGFGVLLILLVLLGVNSIRVLGELRSSNENILADFVDRVQRLDEIRSAIYLSGTYIRDFLLEPEPDQAEQNRQALKNSRARIESLLATHSSQMGDADQALYEALRREIQEYWRVLDPALAWNAGQRKKDGYRFLHDEVLPRRSSTLGIADTIGSVNRQQLLRRDQRLIGLFSGLRNELAVALAVMFLLGFVMAAVASARILQLEQQTLAHLAEAKQARQELRSLSMQLVATQENERKNISRELHDAVGQSMSAVQFELHDLASALAPYPKDLTTRVDLIRELVESSVAMVRNMALLLRPSMLDDLGLVAAIEWQSAQLVRATGVRISVSSDELPRELPDEHKTCIFRIAQEALNNVCRHANANSVEIQLSAPGQGIAVVIQDDGRGFQPTRSKGVGLIGMQERVEGLGGTLIIDSGPGRGTLIRAWLPLPPRLDPKSHAGAIVASAAAPREPAL
ncbi:MAG TPA: histidine kinase [Candidatus Acidoferrales bacterium]|nr:histidine kinase [Candidatus Acidoferrales bacterium]